VTVAIQAGGKSSRMGEDKAFVQVGGRPLIEIVRDRVTPLADELLLVTNEPEAYAHLGLRIVGDRYKECGPLGGMETALYHARYGDVLMVACDMPWLNVDLLRYMLALRTERAEGVDVIVPRWQNFPSRCMRCTTSAACRQSRSILRWGG
jgi:molybdopterin-guanine dinucleotide biosynthesis protein A